MSNPILNKILSLIREHAYIVTIAYSASVVRQTVPKKAIVTDHVDHISAEKCVDKSLAYQQS